MVKQVRNGKHLDSLPVDDDTKKQIELAVQQENVLFRALDRMVDIEWIRNQLEHLGNLIDSPKWRLGKVPWTDVPEIHRLFLQDTLEREYRIPIEIRRRAVDAFEGYPGQMTREMKDSIKNGPGSRESRAAA
jgi:hypothetical protein